MTITKKELMNMTNEAFFELTKDKAVDFHMISGEWKQLCVNELQGFDITTSSYLTRIGITILQMDINYVEIH